MRLLASRGILRRIASKDAWNGGIRMKSTASSSPIHIPFSGRLDPMCDLNEQTFLHKDGGHRVSFLGDKPMSTYLFEDTRTLYQMLRRGARVSRHGECLGQRVAKDDEARPYEYITYAETVTRSEKLGAAILSFGIQPGQDTRIGIFSANRPEWLLIEHACYTYNMVNVPVYATHGPDECLYIMRQASIPLIFCDTADKAQSLIANAHRVPDLRVIVVGAPFDARLREEGQNRDIHVLSFSEFEVRGHDMSKRPPPIPPKPDDIATICYTSGTTGTPKGVQVSHGNIAAVHTVLAYTNIKHDDTCRYLSYLPLAHMYERVVLAGALVVGGRIGFFNGNTQMVLDDCREFRPNLLITVPRVLNKVYNKIYEQVRFSPVKLLLFNLALTYKKILVKRGIVRRDTWADRMIFKKIQALFGGDLDLLVCGSAPLNSEVLAFFRAALGCVVREGYGLTESTACGTITLEGDHDTGHVGVPMPCVEMKLLPVTNPEKKVDSTCGEICFRGPIVAKGYFKAHKITSETFLSDGWLRTGDIGRIDEKGRLVLVDRIKNLVKLPNGEFLVPDKIESVYQQSPFVEQIYVHGQGDRNELVAIIVPNKEYLIAYAADELKLTGIDLAELCTNHDVRMAVAKQLRALGLEKGLSSFEQVSRFYFTEDPFTVENDLLTPTLKNKRSNIAKKYASDITWMYAKIDVKEFRKQHI
ncbi:unnamed protein product, partial [Mesorhabditis belari]|uniref:long-chain-fatty-acid--CoA ligase n=1 Tax=Mesorhabditis belari TaxID=2138241 RepID=A0AAF3JA11_9BILA